MYTSDCNKSGQDFVFVERRSKAERRVKSSISLHSLLFGGRRETIRRHEDKSKFFYADLYNQSHFIPIVLILIFGVADTILTIVLTNHGAKEINPIMAYFIEIGPYTFFSVKYSVCCLSLFIILMFRNIFLKPLKIYGGSLFNYILGVYIGIVSWNFLMLYRLIA